MRLNALFRLAFATAPSFSDLTSPHARNSSAHSSKGTPSGYRPAEAEPATPSDCLWARGFRYCFTPLIGVLFTFPSRYWFTIGHVRVFRLGGWSPHVPTGFHVPRPTQARDPHIHIRGCHPLWPNFPECSVCLDQGTGLVRVRSPLLTESRLMSFPPGTEMFQFSGFASPKPILFSLVIPFPFNIRPATRTEKTINGEGGF